ncbi:MAG: XdhC family protein [Acidobacteriota bacterium]
MVRVDKPTSGQPGDKAIITLDGDLYGWIGGSCARPTVLEEAASAIRDDRSRLIRLSSDTESEVDREGMTDLSMTCFSGGTMEIYIEPHQPRTELLIIGDQPIAAALAALGKTMGYSIFGVAIPDVCRSVDGADRTVDSLNAIESIITPMTFVVVATHGDHDEIAVSTALNAGAGYVGLVASPKRAESIFEYLRSTGSSGDDLSRIDAPAGLDIQARLPKEIALSILAGIVQRRRNRGSIGWVDAAESGDQPADVSAKGVEMAAIDPVCGMTVTKAGAMNVFTHEGIDYYFCCGGCLTRFSADPKSYLQPES